MHHAEEYIACRRGEGDEIIRPVIGKTIARRRRPVGRSQVGVLLQSPAGHKIVPIGPGNGHGAA